MDSDEVRRRMPEVELLSDGIQDEVIAVFAEHAPLYFWYVPASSSGKYHQPDTTGKHGLWLHVKRSFTVFCRMASSAYEQGRITADEVDHGQAGILLHDLLKQGYPRQGHTVSDHDVIAAEYLREKTGLPQNVIDCVRTHNGPWCEGSEPETALELLHHQADMVSSYRQANFGVLKPCEELESVSDRIIPIADDDELRVADR